MTAQLKYSACFFLFLSCTGIKKQAASHSAYNEPHRPQIHFTPREAWMNDPNGMVFYKDKYHLFYQYNPDSTIWGPMHWGHAISTDLVHWQHQPIALYPDSLGTIFSGSAVADFNNTSGFGKEGKVPLVAIFTHHSAKMERAGRTDFQNQSIAYSLDEGKTWTKYAGNPVVKNPGIRDFRDPKVGWHEESKKWIMTLATLDRITFYSSPNLKDWTKESEFGKEVGAHGGVWECPDLFPLYYNGQKIWVLLVSLNPGGPNGGSATQYFTGEFDGKTFTPFATDIRWIDYGPDNYAGVTWANTGNRKIFMGWMSNWQYAEKVPTQKWRSAMTVPRDLSIEKAGDKYLLSSRPVSELNALETPSRVLKDIDGSNYDITAKTKALSGPARLTIKGDKIADFSVALSNASGQKVVAGYDKGKDQYYIDRSASGKVGFAKGFAAKHVAPRLTNKHELDLTLIIDDSSLELFADNGLTVLTQIFFPDEPFSKITFQSPEKLKLNRIEFSKMKSIYEPNSMAGK